MYTNRTPKPEDSRDETAGRKKGNVRSLPAVPALQNKPVQKMEEEDLTVQGKFGPQAQVVQKKENNTGLPDDLKTGMENLSGFSMDDVQVHYNSDKPSQMQALAYAQGTDIHVGPGQEKHLAHEAWHVVQQKQGRVQPTGQINGGVAVNDNQGLEQEADRMGEKAPSIASHVLQEHVQQSNSKPASQFVNNRPEAIAQRKLQEAINNSSRVRQLKCYQEMANNSSRTVQLRKVQEKANSRQQNNLLNATTIQLMAAYQVQQTQKAEKAPDDPLHSALGQPAVVQRNTDEFIKPGLGDERLDSVVLSVSLFKSFFRQTAEILTGKKEIEMKISEHPAAWAFTQAVRQAIDDQLHKLLGRLPFSHAGAAINFALNLILERLRADPEMAKQENAAQIVEAFLKASIKKKHLESTEGEDKEVDEDEESTKAKVSDKHYNDALVRVGKLDPSNIKFNKFKEKANQEIFETKSNYLADQLVQLFFSDLEGNDKMAKVAEFKKQLTAAGKGKDPDPKEPGDTGDIQHFIITLAAKLDFSSAVEMLVLLRRVPVTSLYDACRLQQLLRTKYSKEFPTHPPGKDPVDFASVFCNLKLLGNSPSLIDAFRKGNSPEDVPETDDRTIIPESEKEKQKGLKREFGDKIRHARDQDKKDETDELEKQKSAVLPLYDRLTSTHKTLHSLAQIIDVTLPAEKNAQERLAKISSAKTFALQLFCTAIELAETGHGSEKTLEAYEDLFAFSGRAPGSGQRKEFVEQLQTSQLLSGIDPEVLIYGAKSAASLKREAVKGGWATESEIDTCSKLLGQDAFIGILGSHISRHKYGPLRSIIEQTMRHQEAAALSPPMTSNSLALDTNMIEILLPACKDVPEEMRHRRKELNSLILDQDIRDIRLTNMNVAELGDYGRLIGRTIEVEVQTHPEIVRRQLAFWGVPYTKSRSASEYQKVFKKLEEKKVGENKGHADRSMMADLFLAERQKDHVPFFATADLGVGEEIGDESSKFNPKDLGLPELNIKVIETAPGKKNGSKTDDLNQHEVVKEKEAPKEPGNLGQGNSIFGFIVNGTHTVAEITQFIHEKTYGNPARHFQVYVVGGAVRDYIRGSKIHDVDVKTNMPVDTLTVLLHEHKLPYHITFKDGLYLVTVSKEPQSLDIVCSTKTREEFDKLYGISDQLDLDKDARERDFTMNALYIDASKNYAPSRTKDDIVDPLKSGLADTPVGLLRFVADQDTQKDKEDTPGADVSLDARVKRVVTHLSRHPEEFGRTLKFIERGHGEWFAQNGKPRTIGEKSDEQNIDAYHLHAEVLDILRFNIELILGPFVKEFKEDVSATRGEDIRKGASPAARKNYFLHKAGFKTPMELVKVMQRLQFPPEAIQMIIPDTVAGQYGEGNLAYNRNISPRDRPTGIPGDWDPTVAPKVKVDMTTGELYQHRIYACLRNELEKFRANPNDNTLTKILIDVDFTNHAVSGHPAPHHHVFRDMNGNWVKNETGFSNTGQPGRPPVSLVEGAYVYNGPTPWCWRSARSADEAFVDVLGATCKQAGLQLETHGDGTVTIGDQLHIPLARLQQIDERDADKEGGNKYRLTRLMMLIRTLQQGDVEKDDDSLKYFTQSKRGGERLRFKHQLEKVDDFLVETCGFKKTDDEITKLTHQNRLRLYDLISAGYGKLESRQAALYALRQLGGKFSADQADKFVEYFEFYISALDNRVSSQDVSLLNKRMIEHSERTAWKDAAQLLGGDKNTTDAEIAASISANRANLGFTSGTAAAYHLNKHIEVAKEDPNSFATNEGIRQAALNYIKAAQDAASNKPKKVTHESDTSRVFFFESDKVTTIIEARFEGEWNARILSCYGKNDDQDVIVSAPFFEASAQDLDEKGQSVRAEPVYRTAFGLLRRMTTEDNGNCFFDSVRQSANRPESVDDLRKMAARAIDPNKPADQDWLNPFLPGHGTAQHRLTRLKDDVQRNGFWAGDAGDFVPYMMARALKRPVYILSGHTGRLITIAGTGQNPIYVFYNGANHYEASARVE